MGDLTAALPVLGSPNTKKPKLPKTSDDITAAPIAGECNASQLDELNPPTSPYPIPSPQSQPVPAGAGLKPTPS